MLGTASYDGISNDLSYKFRFNGDQGLMASESLGFSYSSILGSVTVNYSRSRKEVNSILEEVDETLSAGYSSEKFLNYSLITFSIIPSEILQSSRYGFLFALILHPLLNLIDKYFLMRDNQLPFFQDFKIFPMSLTNAEWSLLLNFNSGGLINFLFFTGFLSILCGLFYFKNGIKVSFADIRNIDKLLDYMVTEMPQNILKKYAILEKRGNTIIYYPYSRGFGLLEKTFFKFLLKYEQLELKFDGNVVKIYGLWITVRRLKKQLNVFKLL